jgi:hypothetical protein
MNILNRVIRAALLDVAFFNEVESDTSLNTEALLVVIIVSIAGGIGAFIGTLFTGKIGAAVLALFVSIILGVVNYYIWAYVTYFVGTNLFEGTADTGELLRVLGYASGPRLLSVFSFVPCLGAIIGFAVAIWALVAGFIGVREALDLDTGKTLVTVIIGWIIIFIISAVVGLVLGVGSLGLGAVTSVFNQ